MNRIYIACHKPTGKLLKLEELHDYGHGHFVNSIKIEEMDLTDSTLRPHFFYEPKLPKYINIHDTKHSWNDHTGDLNCADIEFFELEVKLLKI